MLGDRWRNDDFRDWTKKTNGFKSAAIRRADGSRDPWHIFLPGPRPFSFAGWAHNKKLDVTSCTIVTMPAGEPMRQLCDRQPVILGEGAYEAWLDPATLPAEAKAPVTAHNLDAELQFRRVSRAVNGVKNEGAPSGSSR